MTSDNQSRTHFYEKADNYIKSSNPKYQEKTVVKEDMKLKILRCLSNKYPEEFNSRFKTWCRTSFSIRKIGSEDVICDSKTLKPIIVYEKMYNIFQETHQQTAHGGRDKCLDNLSINYSWYNRQLLQIFINSCEACQKRQSVKIPNLSKPIIELGFMTRIQMDLIDMRTRPDANSNGKIYRWIFQLKDHFTKFCWARPLEHKEAREVYNSLREIFFMFGAPKILQSDNGREFVNELINSLRSDFPGLYIVHGRPRHPQSQGLIERANAILTNALGKWMDDHSTPHWSEGLPSIIYAINTRTTHTTKKAPYELVFGQHPRTNYHYWKSVSDAAVRDNVLMDDLIIDQIGSINNQTNSDAAQDPSNQHNLPNHSDNTSHPIEVQQSDIEEIPFTLTSTQNPMENLSSHETVRKTACHNYLKSQSKRQKIYDSHLQKIANSFKNGDVVGISINKVDRTNCDPKIMPCIIQNRSDSSETPTFSLISPFGRLSVSYPVHQLIPMSGISSKVLTTTKFDDSRTISLVEASKLFARGNPSATCDCKTKCGTKICPCKRASIACSTKCHAKLGKCKNLNQ